MASVPVDEDPAPPVLVELIVGDGFPVVGKRAEAPFLVRVLERDPTVQPLGGGLGDAALTPAATLGRESGEHSRAPVESGAPDREARRNIPDIPFATGSIRISSEAHLAISTNQNLCRSGVDSTAQLRDDSVGKLGKGLTHRGGDGGALA